MSRRKHKPSISEWSREQYEGWSTGCESDVLQSAAPPEQIIGEEEYPAGDDTVQLMVTVERPSSDELSDYNRREKFKKLLASNGQHREEIIDWLAEHGLDGQVLAVGEATVQNVIFVESTRNVADELSHAPGVVRVDVTTQVPVQPQWF